MAPTAATCQRRRRLPSPRNVQPRWAELMLRRCLPRAKISSRGLAGSGEQSPGPGGEDRVSPPPPRPPCHRPGSRRGDSRSRPGSPCPRPHRQPCEQPLPGSARSPSCTSRPPALGLSLDTRPLCGCLRRGCGPGGGMVASTGVAVPPQPLPGWGRTACPPAHMAALGSGLAAGTLVLATRQSRWAAGWAGWGAAGTGVPVAQVVPWVSCARCLRLAAGPGSDPKVLAMSSGAFSCWAALAPRPRCLRCLHCRLL